MRRRATCGLALGAALFGCHAATPASAPELPDAAPPPPPAELSRFSAPLDYDFSPVLKVVEHAVPQKFGSIDSVHQSGDDTRRHYAFEADRGPFTAYADGAFIHLRATVSYAARGYYKPPIGPTISGGCGGDSTQRPRLLIELATPLTLTPNWHLTSKATLVAVEPASNESRDHCSVTILHRDVTDRVIEAARAGITTHLDDIDRRVAAVDLRERFDGLWQMMGRPIQISEGVWLALAPRRLAIGNISGRGHTLTIPVTLEAQPHIVTGEIAPDPTVAPLPALARDSVSRAFHITLDGDIDYATASKALDNALSGKDIATAGRKITVTSVVASPAEQGKLSLAVTFNGDASGMIRFIGTPMYDSTRNEIAFNDLDYQLETNDRLLNTYAWLRSDAVRTSLRQKAHVPVQDAVEQGRDLLTKALNRRIGDAMTMNARVRSVRVRGLFVTRDAIVVRAEATGNAAVAVRQR